MRFLRNCAELFGRGGEMLIGVDLKKDPAILNAAYNDRAGANAAFNLNLLARVNRELGGDFDMDGLRARGLLQRRKGPHRALHQKPGRPDGAHRRPRAFTFTPAS